MLAKDLISKNISPLKTSDTGETALTLMDEFKVSHLPIVNESVFLGLISEKDIFELNTAKEAIGNHKLSLFAPFVYESQHFYEALETANRLNLTIVPVLNEKDEYLGVITLPLLLKKAGELLNTSGPGGVIILQTNTHDYALSEIARIVEGENAQILSFCTNIKANGTLLITLKINTENISPILRSFERFDYHIFAYFMNGDNEDNTFEKRLNEFLHYMQI